MDRRLRMDLRDGNVRLSDWTHVQTSDLTSTHVLYFEFDFRSSGIELHNVEGHPIFNKLDTQLTTHFMNICSAHVDCSHIC